MAVKLCVADVETNLMFAKFANGNLINNDRLKDIQLYRNSKSNPKHKILVAETSRAAYRGTNFGPNSGRISALCRNYVGILDKTTNKMHIVNSDWFNMNPSFNDNTSCEEAKIEEAKNEEEEDSRKKRKKLSDDLTMSFGSRQKQKSVESKQRLKVHLEDITYKTKETISKLVVTEPLPLGDPLDALNDILPPINRNAETEADICNLDDLISKEHLDLFEEQATVFSNRTSKDVETWTKDKTYPLFVLSSLKFLPQDETARLHKCKLLLYYNCLVALLRVKYTDLRKNELLLTDIPEPLRYKLLKEYFQGGQTKKGQWRCMSPQQKDKVSAQVIVMALILDDFATDTTNLLLDIKIPLTKFRLLVQLLGAKMRKVTGRFTVKKPEGGGSIVWEVPLPKTVPSKKRNLK